MNELRNAQKADRLVMLSELGLANNARLAETILGRLDLVVKDGRVASWSWLAYDIDSSIPDDLASAPPTSGSTAPSSSRAKCRSAPMRRTGKKWFRARSA